ncbi:MAG TPA: YkgJ family cysteine cluster protein [Candidatus Ozemobacteraceae bacterium]|nr:YkgJ family cysteine cluster protein [Candidatus Ozemobacteraceae bacterium]
MNKVYKKFIASFKIQLKRRYMMLFKKEEVAETLKLRRGECLSCGECCRSSFPCPFLFERDGLELCRIHADKPEPCRLYPFSPEDVFPHTEGKCGYYFITPEEAEKESKS